MEQRAFGANSKGDAALLYTFTNKNGMMIGVTDLGATLHAVLVPDRDAVSVMWYLDMTRQSNMKKELLFWSYGGPEREPHRWCIICAEWEKI